MSYYLARSLRALTNEVNNLMSPPRWPSVGVGDGWVGDTSHQARKSDHNPDYSSGGVVRAVDIGIQGRRQKQILNAVIEDRRVWYVIFRGTIWSRTYGFRARRYTGSNPHNHHIHISIRHSNAAETDTGKWIGGSQKQEPEEDDMPSPKDWTKADWNAINENLGMDVRTLDGDQTAAGLLSAIARGTNTSTETVALLNSMFGGQGDVRALGGEQKEISLHNLPLRTHNMSAETLDLVRKIADAVTDLQKQIEGETKEQPGGDDEGR